MIASFHHWSGKTVELPLGDRFCQWFAIVAVVPSSLVSVIEKFSL
jgi:hypothetical protein